MQLGWEWIEGRSNQIAECVAVAEAAAAAVICVGFDNVSEGEGFDRPFAMPASLEELVVAVGRVQAHTAVVLTAGGNVDMNRWLDSVRGLLYVAYPGQAGGQAIAEILLGSTNPSGKLPVTFERQLEDRSSHDCYHDDDHDQHVRLRDGIYTGYRHTDRSGIAPRFEFGFGLSYTQFRYGSLPFSRSEIVSGESLVVSVEVANVGDRAGAEVVQVYVRDVESSVPRPRQELKGFTKVELSPGESKRVQIELGPRAFAFYDVTQHE